MCRYWATTSPSVCLALVTSAAHAHHLLELDLDLSVHFSHLKEHIPCRDETKNREAVNKQAEERPESVIRLRELQRIVQTSTTMQPDGRARRTRWNSGRDADKNSKRWEKSNWKCCTDVFNDKSKIRKKKKPTENKLIKSLSFIFPSY